MYIITGAAGFIGSCLLAYLNEQGITDIIIVDDFSNYEAKTPNWENKHFLRKIEREDFFREWDAGFGYQSSNAGSSNGKERPATTEPAKIKGIYHLGARTDTTEFDYDIFQKLNVDFSQDIWKRCVAQNIPLVYASSAATYGEGELGYQDRHDILEELHPLNPYGRSKNEFDKWALDQPTAPPAWYGLKFFNVYGPNEFHKDRMASVIFHTYRQLKATGKMKLFRSHRPDFADGHQSRDFIYVKDLCNLMHWLMEHQPTPHGLYNAGTGTARTFLDLATATFAAAGVEPDISFIDTPADIRDKYQYFTEADMSKLRAAGYNAPFHSLEAGIEDYVQNYLMEGRYW
ncbi:ADP-glyceromanno-heptose 6-epimerase [Lewinellaceae bacterium SD302]|nr:ADP-glyceromanno-heptose 6-epimerase [Lewinellaceae bacterium SD302]